MHRTSFQRARLFARRHWLSRFARVLNATLAAVSVVLLVLLLGAVVDLLRTRGALELPAGQSAEDAASLLALSEGEFDNGSNRGLLPLVWRYRASPMGQLLSGAYRTIPGLHSNASALLVLVLLGIGASGVLALSLYGLERSAQSAALNVASELRVELHSQAHRRGTSDLLAGRRSGPSELFSDRVETIRDGLVHRLRAIPHAVILLTLLLLLGLFVHPWISLAALLLCLLCLFLLRSLNQMGRRRESLFSDRARLSMALAEEHLRPRRLSMGRSTDAELPAFLVAHKGWLAAAKRQFAATAIVGPVLAFAALAAGGLIVLLVGVNVLREPPVITLTETAVLGATLLSAWYPAIRLRRLQLAMPNAERAASEVFSYLDREPGVGQTVGAKTIGPVRNAIQWDRITVVSPQGKRLIENVSLSVRAGTRVAIVATDAETPLAVAGVMARCFDPAAGRVLIDDQDLRHATLDSIQRETMLLLPACMLRTASILENIAGPDSTKHAEAVEAAKAAGIYHFVQQLPDAFETQVGDHGAALECDRVLGIAVARVSLHNPSLVILEESPATHSPEVEQRRDDLIERAAQQRTMIVLPNRQQTLRSVSRVLLFHAGRLVADGTHAQLLQDSALYRHLNYMRFNEFGAEIR